MNRTQFTSLMLMLMLSTILAGCHDKITMQYDPVSHTVSPFVHPKDVINFVDQKYQPLVPDFTFGSPCADESTLQKGQCTVAQNALLSKYYFTCGGCQDPEIVVGSEGSPFDPRIRLVAGESVVRPVLFGCKNNQIGLVPSTPIMEQKVDDITIAWEPVGNNPLTGWMVNDFKDQAGAPADICTSPPPPYSHDSPSCTLDHIKVTANTTYTYTVSSSSCSGSAIGKITILP